MRAPIKSLADEVDQAPARGHLIFSVPARMADLVDVDEIDDTAVLWHCRLAPISMCDPDVRPEA